MNSIDYFLAQILGAIKGAQVLGSGRSHAGPYLFSFCTQPETNGSSSYGQAFVRPAMSDAWLRSLDHAQTTSGATCGRVAHDNVECSARWHSPCSPRARGSGVGHAMRTRRRHCFGTALGAACRQREHIQAKASETVLAAGELRDAEVGPRAN